MSSSEKKELLSRVSQGTPKYQRAPPPDRKSTRPVHLALTILILGCVILYAQRSGISRSKVPYGLNGKALPPSYALCTRHRGVYTVPRNSGLGETECVVVGNKVVLDTGSLNKIRRRWGDKKTVGGVDESPEHIRKQGGLDIFFLPEGHTLTPGLIDAHGHVLEYGHYLQLPLLGSSSTDEIVSRVEHFVKHNSSSLPEGAWIEGMGWDQNLWPGKSFPTAAVLESSPVLRGKKISLARIDVHAEWVSQAIIDELEAMPGGLPREVDGGLIVRDEKGDPTGVFVDNAMDLLNAIRPPWTDTQRQSFLDKMARDGLQKGLTGVHNARTMKPDVDFYSSLAAKNALPLRFNLMVSCASPSVYCGDQYDRVTGAGDNRLTIRSVKLFADGALGSRGAALLDDYTDQEGWKGLMLMPEEKWEGVIRKWYNEGWQVNVHTIGDRANKVVIDAIENIIRGVPQQEIEGRFRLEHAQIMSMGDLKRAAKLGIIASYQPTHATSDMWYAEDRLGPERIKGAYAWQSYIKNGGRIALGSDFPVESLDPLKGFYAATTRLSEKGTSPHGSDGWMAGEKLTREQALRGFTVDAAHAGLSNDTGSLTVGSRFDAVVWDDDLMTVPVGEMLDVRVKATIMDGEIVWGTLEL